MIFPKTLKDFTYSMAFPGRVTQILKFHNFHRLSMTVGTMFYWLYIKAALAKYVVISPSSDLAKLTILLLQ